MQQILRTTIRNIGTYSAMWVQVDYEHRRQNGVQQYSFNYRLWIGSRTDGSASAAQWGWAVSSYMYLDGTQFWSGTHSATSTKNWSQSWSTGWVDLAGKTSGTTQFKLYVYGEGDGVDYTGTVDIVVDPVLEAVKVSGAWKYGQLYVKDNGTWKQPIEKFMKINGSWWRKLDYIVGGNGRYINTGIIANSNTKVEIKYRMKCSSGIFNNLFGSRDSYNFFVNRGNGNNLNAYYWYNSTYSTLGVFAQTGYNISIVDAPNKTISNYNSETDTTSTASVTFSSFPNLPMYIFARNNSGSSAYGSNDLYIYYVKIHSSGELIRDMIPVRNLFGSTCGMYDRITNRIFINEGSDSFTCGPDLYEENEIQPIEYLESTGTQRINTGVSINKTGLTAEIQFQETGTTGDKSVIGYYIDGVSYYQRAGGNSSKDFTYTPTYSYGTKVVGVSSPNTQYNASYYWTVFAKQRATTTYDSYATAKVFYCKLYDNGTLVRDFIPARVKATGKLGLYDKITKQLYTNAGTGKFIAGPDVN